MGVVVFPLLGQKGVRKMMNTEQYREHIERTFNAFLQDCPLPLRRWALTEIRKKQQFEVSLDYLREFDFEPVTTTDKYFVKYDVPTACTLENGIYFSCQRGYSDGEKCVFMRLAEC